MNVVEFGKVFLNSLYYSALSGIILAIISLVRVNFISRHSVTWYSVNMLIYFLKRSEYEPPSKPMRYSDYHMNKPNFLLWQITKVVLFAPLLGNTIFGMSIDYLAHGKDIGLSYIANIFVIPFSDIPFNASFSENMIVPLFPALTLIVPAILFAISLRIALYIVLSGSFDIASRYMLDAKEGKRRILSYISSIEVIIGSILVWLGFTMFFSHQIDYNTRYAILGVLVLGVAFIMYGSVDKKRARFIIYPTRTHIYSRLMTIGIVIIIAGATMAINTSIAETKKIDWFGPYISQEITTNRIMHELGNIRLVNHSTTQPTTSSPVTIQNIKQATTRNADILNNIRLWDQGDAKDKLESDISQRNDLALADVDLLRIASKLYWSASTTPKIPETLSATDAWFQEHMVYTHSNGGIKMLEASNGSIVAGSKFFPQQNIYYGKSSTDDGIFRKYWSAFPVTRTESLELDHFKYNGTGGVDLSPPLSWMFEPTFMLSEPITPIHVMRYKDVIDRMQALYPYFIYKFSFGGTPMTQNFKDIEVYPVTDGKKTYWLMPLIIPLDTSSVPWSSNFPSSFMLKLVGYSLIDSYNGNVQIIVTGNDYFSKMFYEEYRDTGATKDIPNWLINQLKYPVEMTMWRISKFNIYHVTDVQQFIDGNNFYSFPDDPSKKNTFFLPYSVFAKPQGTSEPVFLTIEPLEMVQPEDLSPKDLVGYMTIGNDVNNLGNMTFYFASDNSTATKLIAPIEADDILQKNKQFSEIKAAYAKDEPSAGEMLLYKVGTYEVYFNPLFTNIANSGSYKQISKVAAVGASSILGKYEVGVGDNATSAFQDYLDKANTVKELPSTDQQKLVQPPLSPSSSSSSSTTSLPITTNNTQTSHDIAIRIQRLEKVFSDSGFQISKPTAISAPVSFQEAFVVYNTDSEFMQASSEIHSFLERFTASNGNNNNIRIYEWQQNDNNNNTVNFGILEQVNGIVENHYITLKVSG
jgi:uncharacterized membrane protein (UPF0182 family)